MPLGNGDIGLNVWVEDGGDLLFYLSKTDAWDENARLLKLGRVRVSLRPNPFVLHTAFRQELDLATGSIRIRSSGPHGGVALRIWVDANHPAAWIEIDSQYPIDASVFLETWRNRERTREAAEAHCPAGLLSADERETVYPDIVIPANDDALLWCHRNASSCWRATLDHQDLAVAAAYGSDPLLRRTFGALMRGNGLVKDGTNVLRTISPQSRTVVAIHVLAAQTGTLRAWGEAIKEQANCNETKELNECFVEHAAWWQTFWNRSWIHVSGTPEAALVSRGYALQRFVNACGGRGAYPIKFNGSIFTVDSREPNDVFDADYRRWGGGYWFQNTRLVYWPMIMSGDFDLMEPWFEMYIDALPLAVARAEACFGIGNAAVFPETMTFWGTFLNSNYGYERGNLQPGLCESTSIRRYWQGMLELIAVLLDVYAVSADESVLRDKLLVLAPPFLRFYRDAFTQRDDNGKILFKPAQSLETWQDAVNPCPDIAGLQWVLDGLLALPDAALPHELRDEWRELQDLVPPLPMCTDTSGNRSKLLPAMEYDQYKNSENPELYAVFPYRLFGVGKPDLAIGRATWRVRRTKATGGWRQDAIQAALLGLTEEAKAAVMENFSTSHKGSRFPAFSGPNFDWIPDQDHGSVACIALQRMLMQWDDGNILLLPAWPAEWDVDFKLHAPGQTVVEGRYRKQKIVSLKVSPKSQRQKVEIIGAH